MLTKDLLKCQVRAGRVKPVFQPSDSADLVEVAENLLSYFRSSVGKKRGELEAELQTAPELDQPNWPLAGLTKLAFDRVAFKELETAADDVRWQAWTAAEAWRRDNVGKPSTAADLRGTVAAGMQLSPEEVRARLFSDLPEASIVEGFKDVTGLELVNRYNVALVQGLLLGAKSMEVKVRGLGTAERRALLRAMKFHRLLADIKVEKKDLIFRLTGPAAIFDAGSSYGIRLAKFFPHILNCDEWSVVAEVTWKRRTLDLKIDQKAGLISHYRKASGYVPEEFAASVAAFNEKYGSTHKADFADTFIHIGNESYCFPDIVITNPSGATTYVELFHKWHAGELKGRLATLAREDSRAVEGNLVLGVNKSLTKETDVAAKLTGLGERFFTFADFPTAGQLYQAVRS